MNTGQRVIVVGGGVIGAMLAWRLAEAGAAVRLFDAGDGAHAASAGSLGWLNASSATDDPYARTRIASLGLWHDLARDDPGCPARFPGTLLWEVPAPEQAEQAARMTALGCEARVIGRDEIARREPGLGTPPESALLVPGEGWSDPRRVVGWALARAEAAGAEIVHGTPVEAVDLADGRAQGVMVDGAPVAVDHVVLAAGITTAPLLAPLGIRLATDDQPGLILATRPVPARFNAVIVAPEVHFWQGPDGAILAGSDYGGEIDAAGPEATAAEILRHLGRLGGEPEGLVTAAISVRPRPMPQDGFPALGAVPGCAGLSIAMTHSGMTLAPIIAAGLAREIATGEEEPLFAPYRPGRASLSAPA